MAKKKGSNRTVHARDKGEFWQELVNQFQALKDLGALYDSGKTFYAKQLATVAYLLLKDGTSGNNNPLLEQVGLRRTLKFLSTAKEKLPDSVKGKYINFNPPLIVLRLARVVQYIPLFASNPVEPLGYHNYLSFEDWWEEIAVTNNDGLSLTRHTLVNRLRTKDGGAHFDPGIDDDSYEALRKEIAPLVKMDSTSPDPEPIPDGHLATMRQIGWELEQTLAPVIATGPPPLQQPPSTP